MTDRIGPETHEAGTVGAIILPALARFRERPALRDDRTCWTYGELAAAMRSATGGFREAGLVAGQGFAILATSRIETVAIMLAGLLLELRYTPLHPMASAADQRAVLEDADVDLLIVDLDTFGERVATLSGENGKTRLLRVFQSNRDVASIFSAHPLSLGDHATPASIAYVSFTGGTTGRPKGVMLSHRAVAAMSVAMSSDWDWPSHLRLLLMTPISHAAGALLYPALSLGGEIRLCNGFSPERFASIVADEGITATMLVPTMLYRLLEGYEPLLTRCGSLQLIAYGAAPIDPERLAKALRITGPIFLQFYGQTEAPQVIATLRCADHDEGDPTRLRSCGLPSPAVHLRLVDADGADVETGQPGEIIIRGPIVMSGYWQQPEATALTFRDGWLRTGDVGVKDARGFLSIVGRVKDLIITGGFNVYPSEVEQALLSHADVAQAIVVGIPDPQWGEAVVAFIVAHAGSTATSEDLRRWVRDAKGPIYAPKHVFFGEEIPVTALGKPDRAAIATILISISET